jgi:hypothetical protein
MQSWMHNTQTSNGLAFVGSLLFSRLDQLLSEKNALPTVNAALGRKTLPFTEEQLSAVRGHLTESIDGYCKSRNMDCNGTTADRTMPAPATVTPIANGESYPSIGGKSFVGVSGDYIAAKFGQPSMTYDIRPVKVSAYFSIVNHARVLCAIMTTYANSKGINIDSAWNGNYDKCRRQEDFDGKLCVLNLPYADPITSYSVNSGDGVDGFTLQTRDLSKEYRCGTTNGVQHPTQVLLKDNFWYGFTGIAHDEVSQIQMLVGFPESK